MGQELICGSQVAGEKGTRARARVGVCWLWFATLVAGYNGARERRGFHCCLLLWISLFCLALFTAYRMSTVRGTFRACCVFKFCTLVCPVFKELFFFWSRSSRNLLVLPVNLFGLAPMCLPPNKPRVIRPNTTQRKYVWFFFLGQEISLVWLVLLLTTKEHWLFFIKKIFGFNSTITPRGFSCIHSATGWRLISVGV